MLTNFSFAETDRDKQRVLLQCSATKKLVYVVVPFALFNERFDRTFTPDEQEMLVKFNIAAIQEMCVAKFGHSQPTWTQLRGFDCLSVELTAQDFERFKETLHDVIPKERRYVPPPLGG